MKNANIDNGKQVLRGIIRSIEWRNDTSGWQEGDWQKAIEDKMDELHDTYDGDIDLCDLMEYVLDCYDGDPAMTARVACYGLTYVIADAIISAHELDEECYLLK